MHDFTLIKGVSTTPELGAQSSPNSPKAPEATKLAPTLLATAPFSINHHYQTPGTYVLCTQG